MTEGYQVQTVQSMAGLHVNMTAHFCSLTGSHSVKLAGFVFHPAFSPCLVSFVSLLRKLTRAWTLMTEFCCVILTG